MSANPGSDHQTSQSGELWTPPDPAGSHSGNEDSDTRNKPSSAVPQPFPKPGTPEWGKMNQRRAELIEKHIAGTLTEAERIEFDDLQRLSLAALVEAFPYPTRDEERERALEERLRKQEATGG